MNACYSAIPSVNTCFAALLAADPALAAYPHAAFRALVTAFWDRRRAEIRAGHLRDPELLALEAQLPSLLEYVHVGLKPNLRQVLNGTGVIIDSELGRSVLAEEACEAVAMAAGNYCNLEFNLETGGPCSRHELVEGLLCHLSGAEAALVVNNNSAAILLMLDTFCRDGEVLVSRGELSEMGGSLHIADMANRNGIDLVEVGTGERTYLHDFTAAINAKTRALLRLRTARIISAHSTVPLPELARLAGERGLPLIEDLGIGSLVDFPIVGLPREPTVAAAVAGGADLVSFSGDKMLGGPQAGIIVGRRKMVEALKRNVLTRALRCDKLCLAALEATLRLHFEPAKARKRIPSLSRISLSKPLLIRRAHSLTNSIRKRLGDACVVSVRPDVSRVGGGVFAQCHLPTTLVCLSPAVCSAAALRKALLGTNPPLLGRLENDQFCLDPRTLNVKDFPLVARVLAAGLREASALGGEIDASVAG